MSWEICAHLEFKMHDQTAVSISEVHKLIQLLNNKKLSYKQKMVQVDKKRPKMVIYMLHSVKKHFSTSKGHSLIKAHDQKLLSLRKKLVHTAILLFFAFSSKRCLNK